MLDFFDCNVTLGKIKTPMPGGVLDADRLLAEMDRYGVHEALFYHVFAKRNAPARGNAMAVKAAARSDRLHPCWVLLPPATRELPPLETLEGQMKHAGVRAVRIAPDAGNHMFSLAKVVCGVLFTWLARLRIPLFVELGPVPWQDVDTLLDTYPGLRLVLTDVTYRVNRELYPRLIAYPELFVETSGLEQHCGIQDLCERFGPERMLFGSRMPWLCAGAAKHAIETAGISDEAKRLIAGDNLRRLLGEVAFSEKRGLTRFSAV